MRGMSNTLCKYKNIEIIAGVMGRSRASKCGNQTQNMHIKFHGLLKKKEYVNTL